MIGLEAGHKCRAAGVLVPTHPGMRTRGAGASERARQRLALLSNRFCPQRGKKSSQFLKIDQPFSCPAPRLAGGSHVPNRQLSLPPSAPSLLACLFSECQ